ncbi:MAG: iron ABC transporter permease, partial [Caldilineaceae bacterium]|nr:iron ABC transporter permease [Caldilineaceae bacterium]
MRKILTAALYSLPLLFLAAFFFYPLLAILRVSFWDDGALNLAGIGALVRQPFFWRLLWFTTWQAAASTALTLLFGLPLAYVFAHYDFRGKRVMLALTTIPFVMPTVVVAAAFTTLLSNTGLLNGWLQALFRLDAPPLHLMQTIWIILLAHAFYNVAVIVRTVGGFWSGLNPRLGEAAAVLGAGPRRRLREVTLPLLMPSITAAALLVFL